ncbi:N-acetyl-gamma-glutamyl-phosphate reductase [Sandaracinus amylolyticus]|uniref:N-acetyl-gamma-glutamyl-phosphate reductase n=1 Tax=Sandaracinus amylolyticus TaxID=927083 RepID=UPI001F0112DE|nr:N-acetyl-gamma-glutamyl-phosphate reductase [Sandaracinus amylolyticus]
MTKRIRAAIVGATGYTGAELARLLLGHPNVELAVLVGASKAGQPVERVLPSLAGIVRGDVEAFDADRVAARADVAFCGLPHGASAPIVKELRARGVIVFDLSADFRLVDRAVHREWYGEDHAPELAKNAVYGMPELHREALRTADLVAVPGCYPTATILPLAPLFAKGLVEDGPVIVDAKSGVSGAGRAPSERTHFSETTEGFRAYKIAGAHRHTPEIEQELGRVGSRDVRIVFTPHLVPMTRGILSTSYVRPKPGVDAARCTAEARAFFEGSPSVFVHDAGACPDTLWVRGSNRAHVSYALDARTGLLIAQGAIDNLVKGASGQAVQCMNVRFGLPEGAGLAMPAAWP